MDDSYTPCRLSIAVGSYKQDLQIVKLVELRNPRGWQDINLGTDEDSNDKAVDGNEPNDGDDDDDES